jgi:hypothetical protein
MRTLNNKQKKMIDAWFTANWQGAGSINSCDDMPMELLERIEQVNDHETIYQNIDRYINDLAVKNVHVNPTPAWLR